MSQLAFRMMMESGVLRPGDREIRRGPSGVPLHAMSQVPEFLNHSLDVLFGPDLETNQQKRPDVASRPRAGKPAPSQPASAGLSLKGLLRWLGLLDQTNGGSGPESPSPELLVTRLEARIHNLEVLLKAERALCQTQREELSALRAQATRADALEADLAIERESATRLVHWLQEVEQELAGMRRVVNDVGK
ncbi:hypothetical protein ACO9S2_04340 [Nitrospira sp. NS4]|uniref:hypothetical protein n=1 Tax=Nitrospira sp. NS4 TaxID=3414498 RepID=UPI003C2E1949